MTVYLYYLGVCVLGEGEGGGGFLVLSTAECVVETFTVESIHIKVKSEKHIHNMATIFYLYDCISFNDLLNPTNHFYSTHWLQTDKPYERK